MTGYALYPIYKYVEFDKDGSIKRTQHVDSIWLPITPRTLEEEKALAKAYKGDELGAPDPKDYDFDAKDRQHRFNRQIVTNVRQNCLGLEKYSDDEIYNAHYHWSTSEDYPDETKIIEWIGVKD